MPMDFRQRMLLLFGVWSLPLDLHRQSMSWLMEGAFAMELFWLWVMVKAPCCRLAFSEYIRGCDAASQSLQQVACGAVQAAVAKWQSLPEAAHLPSRPHILGTSFDSISSLNIDQHLGLAMSSTSYPLLAAVWQTHCKIVWQYDMCPMCFSPCRLSGEDG